MARSLGDVVNSTSARGGWRGSPGRQDLRSRRSHGMRTPRRSAVSRRSSSVRSDTLTGVTRLQCLPTEQRCSLHHPRRRAFKDPPGIQSVANRWPSRRRTTVLAPSRKPRRRATTVVSAKHRAMTSTLVALRAAILRRTAPKYPRQSRQRETHRWDRDLAVEFGRSGTKPGPTGCGRELLTQALVDSGHATKAPGECDRRSPGRPRMLEGVRLIGRPVALGGRPGDSISRRQSALPLLAIRKRRSTGCKRRSGDADRAIQPQRIVARARQRSMTRPSPAMSTGGPSSRRFQSRR